MTITRILGLTLFLLGIGILGFGINAAQVVENSSPTMWYILSGITLTIAGGLVAIYGKSRDL